MQPKQIKQEPKKNNKKRTAIILSSILGVGILAAAIILPIALISKSDKDGASGGPLSYLDHFSKEANNMSDLTNMDPQLDIFKDLTLDLSNGETDCTQAITYNIYRNYDEATAKQKVEQFLKYLLFQNAISSWNVLNFYSFTQSDTWIPMTIKYDLNKFSYKYSQQTFNISFDITATFSWIYDYDWGQLTTGIPDGYTSRTFISDAITYKSYSKRTYDKGIKLYFVNDSSSKTITGSFKYGNNKDPIIPGDDMPAGDNIKNYISQTADFINDETSATYEFSAPREDGKFMNIPTTQFMNLYTYSKPNEWKLSDGLKGITFKTQ